jgi:AP2 domain/HNH endonuclease
MKRIPLTKGQFALVDDDDFGRLSAYKWRAQFSRCTDSYYAARSSPMVNGKCDTILMHREIMSAKPGEQVDHINHNTLDNQQRSNLRLCTARQNRANERMRSTNTSGYKGVSWDKSREKWLARTSVDGALKNVGRYATAREAAIAHDTVAVRHNGEFALTNKMMGLLP